MPRGIQTAMGILILLGLVGAGVLATQVLWPRLYWWGLSEPTPDSWLRCREVDPDVVVARIEA